MCCQIMEVAEHPEILAAQIKGLVSDPAVKQQVSKNCVETKLFCVDGWF